MLWLLKGHYEAPGWRELERMSKAGELEVVHIDPKVWALIEAGEPPQGHEGITATIPPDGLYVNPSGVPLYIVDGKEVAGPHDVIAVLGKEAQQMLEEIGDPDAVLDRLGRAY